MPVALLRKVGGSVMVTIPPAYLERTGLGPQAEVTLEVEGERLVLRPARAKARYSLAELLAQGDPAAPPPPDPAWVAGASEGDELV